MNITNAETRMILCLATPRASENTSHAMLDILRKWPHSQYIEAPPNQLLICTPDGCVGQAPTICIWTGFDTQFQKCLRLLRDSPPDISKQKIALAYPYGPTKQEHDRWNQNMLPLLHEIKSQGLDIAVCRTPVYLLAGDWHASVLTGIPAQSHIVYVQKPGRDIAIPSHYVGWPVTLDMDHLAESYVSIFETYTILSVFLFPIPDRKDLVSLIQRLATKHSAAVTLIGSTPCTSDSLVQAQRPYSGTSSAAAVPPPQTEGVETLAEGA